MMAHVIASALDISPWEALLLAVRRTSAWAAFYASKLEDISNDDDLRPGGEAHDWVVALERATDKAARYAKLAVDAGVAQMMVQKAKMEGELIARALNAALGAVELTPEQEALMRAALRKELIALESQAAIEGELRGPTT